MTTELARQNIPLAMQHFGQSLPQQERFKHRAWIGVRVEALLGNYWRDRPHEAIVQEMMGDWIAALEGYTREEITAACRAYLDGDDRARKPRPGDIKEICAKARLPAIREHREREARLRAMQDPAREPVSAEDREHRRRVANEILRNVGFARKVDL